VGSIRPQARTFSLVSPARVPQVLWLSAILALTVAFRSAPPVANSARPHISFTPVDTSEEQAKPLGLPEDPDIVPPVEFPANTTDLPEEVPHALSHPDSVIEDISDTLLVSDTTHVEVIDSSARVEHLVHRRNDAVYAEVTDWSSPFYLKIPSTYKREVSLDSTGRIVTVRETVLGTDVKIPITMTLEEYIDERVRLENEKSWRKITTDYRPVEREGGLGGVLGSFTNIDIPVPANPILSIFGPPRINLRISGAVDIRAAFRSQRSDQTQLSSLDQTRNEPNFNQEVQINVNGTIGDKLNILADWNTQRVFEYENQLKIKYTGYEDEIVQSVEAGNVSLATPSFIGSSQALFGIKAKFQTGPLTLTTLLSQKKGQTRELTVTGGAAPQMRTLKAWEYSRSHYFLDVAYRQFYDYLKSTTTPDITPDVLFNRVKDIEVWVSQPQGQTPDQSARLGVAFIDVAGISASAAYPESLRTQQSGPAGKFLRWSFIKLKPADYTLHSYEGYITINTALQDQQALAVAYRIEGPTSAGGDDIFFGEFAGSDTTRRLILKLVRPTNLHPSYKPAWDLMLKNIYGLGGRDLRKEGFAVRIKNQPPSGEAVEQILGQSRKLIEILGLDRFDPSNAPTPDGAFDFLPGLTVDVPRAEIIFPSLEPFRSRIRDFIASIPPGQISEDTSAYIFHEVYDTTVAAARANSTRDRYLIEVEYQAAQSSRYNLGFNLVEGSVRVLLNGNQLVPNVDYTVDYLLGEVVVRNSAALLPNANLQIKYEQNDLFQLASKTLIGARGEMSPFENTHLGFTIMNLNQQTLGDKVRLGEEPTNNTIMGVDGSTSFNLPQLTSALNVLPIYQSREASTLRIGGEAAYMIPDPNTKKSPILSDRGQSIAYIDDFEGARRTIPLGVSYSSWTPSSPPVVGYENNGAREVILSTDSRAKLNWYNVLPSNVRVTDIWPNRSVRRGEDLVTVLNLDFHPTRRGMYNYSRDISSTLLADPRKNWNGVMKYLSATGSNLLEQNIAFLEIWMLAEAVNPDDVRRGRLFVNLGVLSEAIITHPADSIIRQFKALKPEDPLSEDLVVNSIANGILNPGEDVGIDMLTDAEEGTLFPDLGSDPSGDNYHYSTGSTDFDGINGPEGNQFSVGGQFPNTEDINGNYQLDIVNNYLEYEIPLDTVYVDSLGFERTNTYIVGGGVNKWYQFRIPILTPTRMRTQGTQTAQDILQNLQFVRLYVSGVEQEVRLRIADINLVGNQWQELTRDDSVLKVSVVNIEDNPDYTSPPGVIRERDRTQPDQLVLANEQSLSLILTNLAPDSMRQVFKNYPVRPLDVFSYKAMKMFVHGDPNFFYLNSGSHDASVFLRFGADTTNFYEYRQPIRPGWTDNDIEIVFAELTAIKTLRESRGDSINVLSPPVPVEGRPGAEYRIRGNPTLTSIRSIWVGIINTSGTTGIPRLLSGEVWINELRLIGVDDEPGFAYRFDSQLRLADLGDVTFNFSKIDPQFHGLEQRFGSRVTNVNWGIAVSLGLSKFLPENWQGSSVPFNYSHNEAIAKPKYLPNTDVEVDEAAGRASSPEEAERIRGDVQTLRTTETYAVPSLRIGLPSQEWYIRDIVNKLTFSFTHTSTRERSPVVEHRRVWQWNSSANYSVSLPPGYYVEPFTNIFDDVFFFETFRNLKLYYAPTSVSAGVGFARSQARERARGIAADRPITRNFTASRSAGFGYKLSEGGLMNISGDYGLTIESNLTHMELDSAGNQRTFSAIVSDLFFQDKLISFGRDGRYAQRFTANSRPKVPPILSLDKYMDLTLGYSVNYTWQNNFQRGDIDKSAAWDNSITATTAIRLKALTASWLPLDDDGAQTKLPPQQEIRRRGKPVEVPRDTTAGDSVAIPTPEIEGQEVDEEVGKASTAANLKRLFKFLVKIPFLEYENINLSFNQSNRSVNGGVVGGPGFRNFWERIPFFQDPKLEYGPTRLYQLGIVSDPSGRLRMRTQSAFPFFGFDVDPGPRAAKASIVDQHNQTNRLTMRTSRALWEGASVELNWNVGWTFSKSTQILTDSLGIPTPGSVTTSGSVDRSFFTLPPVFFLKVFKSGIEDVGKHYNLVRRDTTRPDDVKLAEAFEKGFEALPVLRRVFGDYFPRMNYAFRWDGLERMSMFSSFTERLSLEHSYQSTFTRQWRGNPDGGERTDAERVTYGFAPLLGVNAVLKELMKGNINANIRYNSSTSFDLNTQARNIVETYSQEIAFTLSYARRGFEFLMFGINLSNDIDIGLTYSLTKNSRRTHQVNTLETDSEGTPLEGSTRTVLEPRIRYVLSARVTASIFYRYTKVAPDQGGSTIPGTTTNEAGLDIHIAIQ
jgi:hypothetical protein